MAPRTLEQEREATAQRESKGSNSSSSFFRWKDGDSKTVRFLTDGNDILFTWVHNFVPCADNKKRSFVCATEVGRDCELCDEGIKRNEVGYGVVLFREEEKDSRGKIVGYRDVLTEVDGEVVPSIAIITQSWNNFWTFIDSIYMKHGTVRDFDIDITRKGDDKNTVYSIMPNPPEPIDGMDEMYGDLTPNTKELIARMASTEYYDLHLRGIKPEKNDSSSSDEDQEKNDQYEALAKRLRKN